ENLRTDVTNLSSQMQGVTTNLNTVLDLRKSLSDPSGAPIDVAGIQAQVKDLQSLRANLTGVDGSLVRIRDFELRVSNVEDALQIGGTGAAGGLDGRINSAVTEAESRLTGKLTLQVNQLGTNLQASGDAASAKLSADLKTQLDASNQATDAKLAAAEGRIGDNVNTQIAS